MEVQDKTLLSFQIQDDIFAVNALTVAHILELPPVITSVPNTPEFMKGIINLHGNIVPVADMRVIMGRENFTNGADTSIIVLSPKGDQDDKVGILVDMVQEVFEYKSSELKETVLQGKKGMLDSFEGTLLKNGDFIHVIDIKSLTHLIEE
ncbi:chemotaxis protein CheW [Geofilum sp. OHC36d9]|uniref:chemotaxis protein CheW n=1 Tax=Geofilum sp. OHC36d9 TaxID=3458413 RepID=UPI0040339307